MLRLAVESVSKLVKELLAEKLRAEPDAEPVSASESSNEGDDTGLQSGSDTGGRAGATVVDVNDAEARVISAAHYLRKREPAKSHAVPPASHASDGESCAMAAQRRMRSCSSLPVPRCGRSSVRSTIEKRWESLLEATEQIMGSRVGRGWLDLQFYAVHACEALGEPYDDVRSAIVGALRTLLADLPSLRELDPHGRDADRDTGDECVDRESHRFAV